MDKLGEVNRHTVSYMMLLSLLLLLCGGCNWVLTTDYIQAMTDFNTALQLNPINKETYNGRGLLWSLEGDYKNALADLGRAIKIDPTLLEGGALE